MLTALEGLLRQRFPEEYEIDPDDAFSDARADDIP
jgi:hypothetical protein